MEDAAEFDRKPVRKDSLLGARPFAASYASEHVAGTEFVIGAMFVAWGVSTADVIIGLIAGNLLAVLSWVILCAPVAIDTRLTLYAYLEKIGGPGIIKLYSLLNGIFFVVLGGAMITVSASAVRLLFDIPAQINWYPDDWRFVIVAVLVGLVVATIAARGFGIVARFAQICAPWMIVMFGAGALALWPSLQEAASAQGVVGFQNIGDAFIWVAQPGSEMTVWHVAAFAWICNLPMHVGMSDMSVLRFARKGSYAAFSAFGMYIGHFGAWIAAGVMGAGAAHLMQRQVTALDAGDVAFQALGAAGIVAVIIAGWTTSNPTIYRAGLAFQSLNHNWDRKKVTLVVGVLTTIIACFPFVFTRLMDFLGLMGLLMAPIGAVIIMEHWVLPKLGMTRYWASAKNFNVPAGVAWALSLLIAFGLNSAGLHLFFLLIPTWISASVIYLVLVKLMAGDAVTVAEVSELAGEYHEAETQSGGKAPLWGAVAMVSLAVCAGMALAVFGGVMSLEVLRSWMILPSLIYFVVATVWIIRKEGR